MKALLLAALTVTTLAGIASAQGMSNMPIISASPKAKAKTPIKKAAISSPLICPVTGTKIASAAKAYNKEAYKGKTYYFCCPECKPRFDKNPDAIIKHASAGKYDKM